MMDAELPASSHQDDVLDRSLLRHLLRRYGKEGVAQLMDEEAGSSVTHNDRASIVSSSTYSSVKSEDAPSIFDAASIRTFSSDTSSISSGSIISNVSARTAKFLGRKTHSSPTATRTPAPTEDTAPLDPASANAPKQKGAFTCGFCKEEDIQKTCTRKNDLKRHMEDFHNMNSQWFCRHRGCAMVFDWQTAYKTHLKQAHGGSRMSLDEAKVNLCPQTVFACGFENCIQVFEAAGDDEAESMFKEYVSHVVKHFDEGASSGEWSYSARMRNLLRQTGVVRAWTTSSWPEAERNRLRWHPQSSGILRKRLETRHLGDLHLLVQYAIALGSDPSTVKGYREDFITPYRDDCQQTIPGHKPLSRPPPASAPEPDSFQFRISRNTDPSLAAYLASQRRVYVPRPGPVRAGRSARPPMRAVPTSAPTSHSIPAQYRYSNTPSSPIYDAQQQPQFAMMSHPGGGIIAEDLRSLRSMASNVSEQDIEMGDAQMVDAGYMQQQNYSDPYGPDVISSPTPDGSCLTPTTSMEHIPFAAYDSAHAY